MILDALVSVALVPDADRIPQPSRSAPTAAVRLLRCVVNHESRGNPRAENPRSTASGLFQFLDGTWRHYAKHVPSARKYRHAAHAPAATQWEVALLAVKWGGKHAWDGTHCAGVR